MKYTVRGTKKTTGAKARAEIEAESPEAARRKAAAAGLLAESCTLVASDAAADEKECPFCGERIKAKAIKCRFCGEMLHSQSAAPSSPASAAQNADPLAALAQAATNRASKGGSSGLSRFARGGALGLVDERFCAPEEQMRLTIKGKKTRASVAKRLLVLILLGIGGFIALIVFIGIVASVGDSNHSLSSGGDSTVPISSTTFAEFDSKFSVYAQTTDEQKKRLIEQFKGQRVRWQGIVENVDGDTVYFKHKATTMTYDVSLTVLDSDRQQAAGLSKGVLVTYEGTIEDFGTVLSHKLVDGHIVDQRRLSGDEQVTWLAKSETAALQPIADEADRK